MENPILEQSTASQAKLWKLCDYPVLPQVEQSIDLPRESGTIEFKNDGSVTVTGHRVRLKSIADFIHSDRISRNFAELSETFPTIEPTLMLRVIQYIAKHQYAVEQHVREIDRDLALSASAAPDLSIHDIRRLETIR